MGEADREQIVRLVDARADKRLIGRVQPAENRGPQVLHAAEIAEYRLDGAAGLRGKAARVERFQPFFEHEPHAGVDERFPCYLRGPRHGTASCLIKYHLIFYSIRHMKRFVKNKISLAILSGGKRRREMQWGENQQVDAMRPPARNRPCKAAAEVLQ